MSARYMMFDILHLPFSGQLVLFLQLQPKDVSFGFKMFLLWVDINNPDLLNKKSELINKCRHVNKILLKNV